MEIKTIKIDNKEYEIKVNEDKTLTLTEIKKVKTRPNRDEKYYSIETVGGVGVSYFNAEVDKKRWSIGNGFFTKEEAEKELERRKVIQLLKEFKLQHDPVELDWENYTQKKWAVAIDGYKKNKVCCIYACAAKMVNTIYFSSKDLVEQAIKEIGKERIYEAFK